MTKEKYMALADVQTIWTSSIKPWIVAGFIAVTAVESGATPKLVLQDGTLLDQSTFAVAGNYIEALGSTETGHDNLLLADGTNIAQSTFIPATEKGANSGVATLGADGKVPSSQLPSYVDDVIEAANFAALPATGEAGKIYVTLDDNKSFILIDTVGFVSRLPHTLVDAFKATLEELQDAERYQTVYSRELGLC